MKILMTGATGLIGSELGFRLVQMGHDLTVVTRNQSQAKNKLRFEAQIIECDLNKTSLSSEVFNGIDAIINLAGESIDGYWTPEKKRKILNSRESSSQNLLVNCPETVKTIITASAQGIYGDRADEELTEESKEGDGFLADVCRAWEKNFRLRISSNQQRIVILRIGMVMSKKGGALKKIESIFRKNLGAVLGSGQQWMSYISLNDLVRIIIMALGDNRYSGVINAVNGEPVTNAVFTKALCRTLNVIQLPSVPKLVLKLLLGEMSHLVLDSLKVKPQKLIELGFQFEDKNLDEVLKRENNS